MTYDTDFDRLRESGHDVMAVDTDTRREWVSIEAYLALETKYNDARRALTLINAYHQLDRPVKVRSILDAHGYDAGLATATVGIIAEFGGRT